jgi:hypothetical protein
MIGSQAAVLILMHQRTSLYARAYNKAIIRYLREHPQT